MKSKLVFIIMQTYCHPEFGGQRTKCCEFDLAEFIMAEKTYDKKKEGDCHCQHTTIQVVEKELK